jgi:hypothetical protein
MRPNLLNLTFKKQGDSIHFPALMPRTFCGIALSARSGLQ